ncbi:hypothetical protein FHT32_001247 [Variovorax sp. SG517]|uniref:hypothetical protein n=1 Tax=Variovorax sp. SG517 TaxID=2587117 RepID=UPI00159DEF70|nr:hypothetical protein [Variovorax sp. SG517]NVM87608.1 hypothetical protein [Variovorax sp. SG517]
MPKPSGGYTVQALARAWHAGYCGQSYPGSEGDRIARRAYAEGQEDRADRTRTRITFLMVFVVELILIGLIVWTLKDGGAL